MKIKTKKQLNLPQLIEWAWDNKIKSHIIRADKQLMNIQFDEHGDFRTYGFTGIDTTFTVEVEEEITEDTKIANLLDVHLNIFDDVFTKCHKNKSIKEVKDDDRQSQAFYILNDDLTMTLIWRDGKLVD